MSDHVKQPGRLRPAPENFLSEDQIQAVAAGRRNFLRQSFLAAGAALAAPMVARASEGDPDILNLPEWSTTLGQPVATRPYGMPSKFESQLLRRESPGLARVGGASVSFCPLQGLFPSGARGTGTGVSASASASASALGVRGVGGGCSCGGW